MEERFIVQTATPERLFVKVYRDFLNSGLLSGSEQIIFIHLKQYINFSDDNGAVCGTVYPKLSTLARNVKMTEKTVREILKELKKKGIIEIKQQGLNKPNIYKINDIAAMWKTENIEELKESIVKNEYVNIREISTEELEKELERRKNKVPETTEPPKVTVESDTSLDNNSIKQDYKVNESNCQEVQNVLERYPLEQIKEYFYYEAMVHDNPYQKRDIDSVMSILHTALNTTKNTIRIGGEDKPTMSVIGKLMKLTHLEIMYAIEQYNKQTGKINFSTNYMLKLLYVAKEQMNLDTTNRVQYDMAHQNQTEEVKEQQQVQNYEENQLVNQMEQAIEVCKNYSKEQEAEYKERYKKTVFQAINQDTEEKKKSFDKQEAMNDLEKEWSKSNQETKKQQEQNKGISLPSEPQRTQNNETSKEDKAMPKSAENYNDYEQRQYSQEYLDDLEAKLCALAVQQSD